MFRLLAWLCVGVAVVSARAPPSLQPVAPLQNLTVAEAVAAVIGRGTGPLGLLLDSGVTPKQLERLQALASEPLPFAVRRVMYDEQVPQSRALQMRTQFLQWTSLLVLAPDAITFPSSQADVFWHAFVLFTKPYAAWCDRHFGRFLHHTPFEDPYQLYPEASRAKGEAFEASLSDVPAEPIRSANADQETWAMLGEKVTGHMGTPKDIAEKNWALTVELIRKHYGRDWQTEKVADCCVTC